MKVTSRTVVVTVFLSLFVLGTVGSIVYRKAEDKKAEQETEQYYYDYLIYGRNDRRKIRIEDSKKRLAELNKNGISGMYIEQLNITIKEKMQQVYNIGDEKGQKKWGDLTATEQYIAGEGTGKLGDESCKAKNIRYEIDNFARMAGLDKTDIYNYISDIPKKDR